MQKGKKKLPEKSRRRLILACAVILLICLVLGFRAWSLFREDLKTSQREEQLQTQLEDEKELTKEIQHKQDELESGEYTEEQAREEGLTDPDEITFKAAE